MLTLYWFWSFNPQKVRLALEEMKLDYSLVTVDLAQGGEQSPLIGQLNPNRKVPILVWDEYRLWESNAILTYLGAALLVYEKSEHPSGTFSAILKVHQLHPL